MEKRKKVEVRIDRRFGPDDDLPPEKYLESYDSVPWDVNDPGVGHALLLPDGREVLNPVPVAPPVGYVKEPTVMEMINAQVKKHLALLRDDEELDTEAEAQDFNIGDDYEPYSPYEILMSDEFPSVPVVEPEVGATGATGGSGDAGGTGATA